MQKLLSLSVFIFLLAACTPKSAPIAEDESVTLKVWYTAFEQVESADGPINPWQAGFDYIEAQYPNIKIDASFVSNDTDAVFQKLETAIQGGTAPDVVLMFDRFIISTWANNGYLEDITELAQADNMGNEIFFNGPWEEVIFEDKIYGLPLYTDARALIYNKALLQEAGFNKPPETWEDLKEYSVALTRDDPNDPSVYSVIGFQPTRGQSWFYTYAFPAGVEFIRNSKFVFAQDPGSLQTMELFKWFNEQFSYDKIVRTSSGFSSSAVAGTDAFASGKIAMEINGPWALRTYRLAKDLDFGLAPIPYPVGRKSATWSGGHSAVIPVGSKHKAAAYTVLKEFTTGEPNRLWCEQVAYIPALKDLAAELYQDDEEMGVFIDLLQNSFSRPPTVVAAKLWEELKDARDNVLYGNKEPQEALDDAQENVIREQKILDR